MRREAERQAAELEITDKAIDMLRLELKELDRQINGEKKTIEALEKSTNEVHMRLVGKQVEIPYEVEKKKVMDTLAQKDSTIQNLKSKIETLVSHLDYIQRMTVKF